MIGSEDVGPQVMDLALFPDFTDRMWWILAQDNIGTSPG
jgi:hypothetical protein